MAKKFPSDPSVLLWSRKIHKCQKPKKLVTTIKKMKPPDNCSHEAYIVCLTMGAVRYTELLEKEENVAT